MEESNALYALPGAQEAAALDALFWSDDLAREHLVEYLTVHRVVLGDGGFCLLASQVIQPVPDETPPPELASRFASMLEAELAGKTIYYLLPLQGLIICLVAMPQYGPAQQAKAQRLLGAIRGGITAATARFRQETACDILTACSPVSFGVSSLRMTFRRTVDMVRYHRFFGTAGGLVVPPTEAQRDVVQMPLELSNGATRAVNRMSVQQYDGFQEAVRQQLHSIRDAVPASLQQYKLFCFQFLDILSYRLVQGGMGSAELLAETDLYWLIDDAADYMALERHILDFLDRLTAPWRDSRVRMRQRQADAMRQYILEHYTDPNLNVTSMAARFGMTQPAFSAYFKKHTGISPQAYLCSQRLKRAIELLQTTDLTQPVIAEQAGFGSSSTMHRLIRQEMGMTPAQVRQMQTY